MTATRRELLRGLSPDARELLRLFELELLAADVYGLAHRSRHLSPPAARLTRELQVQEQVHGQLLSAALGRPAHVVPLQTQTPPGLGQLQLALSRAGIHAKLTDLRDERRWFTLLEELESGLEGAYYEALARLTRPTSAMLAARILASEAQHQTLLFALRHPGDVGLAVSTPIVYGNAPPPP